MRLFLMNSGQARARLVQAGPVSLAVLLIAGCGSAYRPVVTPINNSGPAAQPSSYVIVVSAPSTTTPGIVTIIDYSGDAVLAIAPIGPGPNTFTIDEYGANGYTINSDGTMSNFPISSSLQAKQITYSTLPRTAQPVNLFAPTVGLWAADLDGNLADYFAGSPQTFKLSIPVAQTPVLIVGSPTLGQRDFVISQNIPGATGTECNSSPASQPNGLATGIEVASFAADTPITLGKCPVFAIESPDQRRVFVLNRGSDTVSVINAQDNTLDDQCPPPTGCVNQAGQTYFTHPSLPLSTTAGLAQDANNDVPKVAGPVYAEYNTATSQLVVADYAGNTISIIDVSVDEYGNDSPTFGTTFTVPVGKNPASVTVLYDGSRAYTANQTDQTSTIVNLSSHTVEKTLPVNGHPRTVVSTQNSVFGKVYVASPDSPFLTILRTDLDIVDTTILVEGNVVDVRASTQNGTQGNVNVSSHVPGWGQPCYLPPGAEPAPTGSQTALQVCQTLP